MSRAQSSSRRSAHRTVAPVSAPTASQGAMLASWSSCVTTTSSPGERVAATDRDSPNASVVMFWPNTHSSALPPRRSAAAERPSAMISSVSRLVAKAPPVFALCSRR